MVARGPLRGYGLGILFRHAGIRQHKDAAVLNIRKLVQVGKAAALSG